MPSSSDAATADARAALERLGHLPGSEQIATALLQAVVDLTPTVLPGRIETSVTLLADGRPGTAASSSPLASELDECQYSADAGPCLHAARTGEVTEVSDTGSDQRWATYARCAAARGAVASLSLPLPLDTEEQLAGSLNIYARDADTLAAANRAAAIRFADLAGLAVRNLTAYHRARDHAGYVHTALTSRGTIQQAKRILMERHRLTAEQASRVLARASTATHRKVHDLAEHLVRTGQLLPLSTR